MENFKKANDLYNQQDYRRAISVYNKAMKNKDNEIPCIHNVALCYIKLEQYNRAIPLLRAAIAKNPKGKYFFNLAYAHYMIKDYKKALVYCNRAWALSPDLKESKAMIDRILRIYRKDGTIDRFA